MPFEFDRQVCLNFQFNKKRGRDAERAMRIHKDAPSGLYISAWLNGEVIHGARVVEGSACRSSLVP